jgi:uncharacterized membrane protein YeaQ/YmgE (transglycosylase-associated protein family)
MVTVAGVIGALIIAFITGALARFALPGPDPMPAWLTVVVGLIGFIVGSGLVFAIGGRGAAAWSGLAAFGVAVLVIVAYRRFVQKRPLWGKDAYRFPERGFGVDQYRERLRNVGIDPDQIGTGQPLGMTKPGVAVSRPATSAQDHPGEPTENPAHYLGLLEELHDSGVLDDSEYDGARLRLLETLR